MNKKKIISSVFGLLALSPLVAESASDPTVDALPVDQITYVKDFSLQVYKEPVVSIELPTEEVVEIELDSLVSVLDTPTSDIPPEGVVVTEASELPVGAMEIATSAVSCKASISTNNDFNLVGKQKGFKLVEYEIIYTSGEGDQTTQVFGNNYQTLQDVGCNTASLDMKVIRAFNAPADDYDDVIRVSVEAES